MLGLIRQLLELIRFSHTLFALPFALTAAVLAWTAVPFRWLDLIGILWCLVWARSAAMAFNRLVDRSYDAANPRTAGRHLPAGRLSIRVVTLFCLVSCLQFVGGTALFLWQEPPNYWPLYLSGPVLLWILGYSYAKRFTLLVHFWLGSSLMLAPLATWIALRGMHDLTTPLVLGAAVALWVAGFDILYACQDADFDRRMGLYSLPARLGVARALRIAALCHVGMFVLLALLPLTTPSLRTIYYVGLVGIAALLIYEHRLLRPDDLSQIQRAFFHTNAVISVGLLVIVVLQLLLA